MKSVRTVLFCSVLAAALPAGFAPAQDRPTTQPTNYSYRDRYSALWEHNIFLKERGRSIRSASSGPTSREYVAPKPPEASFVLTGVVLEEGMLRAYIEDAANSKVVRLVIGDPVARGRVSLIEFDGIEYEKDGQAVWVDIGKTLTGQAFAGTITTAPTTMASTGASTGAAPGPLPDPNNPNLSLEERMKLRRAQELNRK